MKVLVGILLLSAGLTSSALAFTVTNSGSSAYVVDGVNNRTLTLTRGQTYQFNVNALGHPFHIKSVQGAGTGNDYNNGVTNNAIDQGTITFNVPVNAPATLFYNCEFHGSMTGTINTIAQAAPGLSWPGIALLCLMALAFGAFVLRRRAVRA